MAENIENIATIRNRVIKIIKAYETFCDKSNFKEDEQTYVQKLLDNYKETEFRGDKNDLQTLTSIYNILTQENGISSKIVEQLYLIGFCTEKDTLECLNNKQIDYIKSKINKNCHVVPVLPLGHSVGGKKSKRSKQRKTNRKSKKQRNKKRR